MLRVIPVLALLVVSAPARAGGFAELGGGVMVPAGDNDWTNYVDASAKLFIRGGFVQGTIGGMLSFDWTPINVDPDSIIGNPDISANRFRILGHIVAHVPVGQKLTIAPRFGIGADIQSLSVTYPILGTADDTDTGLALEPGIGIWFSVAEQVQVGGELAVPMSFHSYDDSNEIRLNDFTSIDVDLLIGLRFVGRGDR